MSVLAAEYNALILARASPDFMMDEELVALVNAAMQKGNNQYVHMNGTGGTPRTTCRKDIRSIQRTINPETEITIHPAVRYAIYRITTARQPGDEVIVFEPAYDSYILHIETMAPSRFLIPLSYPDYKIDGPTGEAEAFLLNKDDHAYSPHNPTGAVLSADDIVQLGDRIVKDSNIFYFE